LGGSFNAIFRVLGVADWHGPVIGTLSTLLLSLFFFNQREQKNHPSIRLSNHLQRITIGLSLALILIGVSGRMKAIRIFPLDRSRADMLLTIQSQIDDFFSGRDPNAPQILEDSTSLPRFYLPGLWLSYAPFHLIGVDIRYLNLVAQTIFCLLILSCFVRKKVYPPLSPMVSAGIFVLLLGVYLFSKQAVGQLVDVQTGPFWLYYSLFLWAMSFERRHLAYALIPMIVLCRHTAFLLVFPLCIYWARFERVELRKVLWFFILGGSLAFFFIKNFGNLYQAFQFYALSVNDVPESVMLKFFGPAGMLKRFGFLWLQAPLQTAGVLVAMAISIFRKKLSRREALALGGFSYLIFVFLVGTPFGYLYTEPLLLAYFLLNWRNDDPRPVFRCTAP